ncbi:hypothetical protein P3S67_013696 [Capsicum chacoense]
MLLRSSSTPVSQTILVESKKNDFDGTSSDHYNIGKVSFHTPNHLCSFSCNSSPEKFIPKRSNNNPGRKLSPRRVQSEGNLKVFVSKCDVDDVYRKGLVYSKCDLDEVWLVSECDLDEVCRKGLVSKCDVDEVWLVSQCDLDEVYTKLVAKSDLDEVCRKGLVSKSDLDEVYRSKVLPRSCHNQEKNIMLQTELSFSIYSNQDFEEMINDGKLVRAVTIGNEIEDLSSDDFSFGKSVMGLIKEDDDNEDCDEKEDTEFKEESKPVGPMYLAAGLGIDVNVSGIDGDVKSLTEGGLMRAGHGADAEPSSFDENGDVEAYYKSLLEEYPFNPLVLTNYAQLLQSRGDLSGAEEYYFRATLTDPKDGEILSQYARLVWQLHRDKDRALNYFERAAHAASDNSHVLAAYASFLWEIDHDDNDHTDTPRDENKETGEVAASHDMDFERDDRHAIPLLNLSAGFGIDSTCGFSRGMTLNELIAAEGYYTSMIQENPNNPLVLRNYAQFLDQCKGDLTGAEEYYSRAVLADASDGEVISQYANFIWQLHHDQNKASSYFKRAVQASPRNSVSFSDVLAAYARFLWDTNEDEDEDEDEPSDNHIYTFPYFHGIMAAPNA